MYDPSEEYPNTFIKASYDNIILKQIYEKKNGNIIFPENSKNRPFYGLVISIGSDVKEDIILGDKVIFPQGEGHKVFDEKNEEFLSIRESHILGIFDRKNKRIPYSWHI